MKPYVHGYSDRESRRLCDQAGTLGELLHHDTRFSAGSRVLEMGCGVGAQTAILASNSPEAHITAIDNNPESLEKARAAVSRAGFATVDFQQVDLFHMPYEAESFDHVFICFVLEHLRDPVRALVEARKVLKTGGSITVIEGDHGSFFCHPQTREAARTVQCLIDLQAEMGGNSLIGRELYPLMVRAGFPAARVSPRMVYVDAQRPALVEGFTRNTFIAMVEGVRDRALQAGMMDERAWDQGIGDLHRATRLDGVFCYTFFKANALK